MQRTNPDLAYISETLKGAAQRMSERDRFMALDCFKHWRSEFTRIEGEGESESVAHTVHGIIDERMQHLLSTSGHAPDVPCRKGCASCCHLSVDINLHEAALLLMVARAQGIEIDMAKLARQADKATREAWHELPIEDRRCVFLGDDNACKVHEHRPGACRKYLVKGDPDLCDTTKHPGGRVAIVFDVQAEIVQSAAMTVYGGDTMAAMLLKVALPR
jgi:Fe-S-cluster containining protein